MPPAKRGRLSANLVPVLDVPIVRIVPGVGIVQRNN